MAEELTMVLERRAERGTPRGAADVLAEARQQAFAQAPPPWWRRGPVIAFAAAVVVFLVVGGILLATRAVTPDTVPPATTIPETPTIPVTTLASEVDLVPAPGGDVGAADVVVDLAIAPDGRLWAATNAGVVSWNLDSGLPTMLSEREGLPDRHVYDIVVTSDGTVWAAGDAWVGRLDGTAWTDVTDDVLSDLPHPIGALTAAPDGSVWVAAGRDALIEIDSGVATTHRVPEQWRWSVAEPWTFSMAVDSDGTVWAPATQFGVLAFDGGWRHFGVDEGLPSDFVGNVAVATDGSVWVGGDGMYGDPGGDTPAAGILRYRDGQWTTYTTADGLLSDEGRVTVDPAGGVWVVHTGLPPHVAENLGVDLREGISYFDGTSWQQYPAVGARGEGVVSTDGMLWLPSDGGIVGFDGVEATRLIVGEVDVPPLGPPGEPVVFEPVDDLDPVRLSTAIGDIEFTTLAIPDDWGQLWWMTATAHGVVATAYPETTLVGSLDGTMWTEIPVSVEPGRSLALGDDIAVSGWGGTVRLQWNGTAWVETATIMSAQKLPVAAGPRGIVAANGTNISYSTDGSTFTEATAPPDLPLHGERSAGCSAPGWVGESAMKQLGPVVATENGFVALAARSAADWTKSPVCEPLVWVSADGDVWIPTSDESPFGPGAFVHDLTALGNTIVAVGGVSPSEAAVWTSDGGVDWQRADVGAAELWQVTGGDRGWILTGHLRPDGETGEMWFSTEGITWDGPYARPPGWGDRSGMFYSVTMLGDRIIGAGKQFDRPGMAMDSAPARVVVGVFVDD